MLVLLSRLSPVVQVIVTRLVAASLAITNRRVDVKTSALLFTATQACAWPSTPLWRRPGLSGRYVVPTEAAPLLRALLTEVFVKMYHVKAEAERRLVRRPKLSGVRDVLAAASLSLSSLARTPIHHIVTDLARKLLGASSR